MKAGAPRKNHALGRIIQFWFKENSKSAEVYPKPVSRRLRRGTDRC